MERLEGNFESEFYLVTMPDMASFDPSALSEIVPESAYGLIISVNVNATPTDATVFSVNDESGVVLGSQTPVTGLTVLEPNGLSYPQHITLSNSVVSLQVDVAGHHSLEQFPDTWLLGSPELLADMTGDGGKANYAITASLSDSQRGQLAASGFSVQAMTGIIDFLGQSVDQIRNDMVLLLIPSVFAIAVLSYGFMGRETADRRHSIGILKTVGADRATILRSLMSNALLITLWGGALGLAFGVVLSYLVSTAASSVFTSVFVMRIDIWTLAIAYLSTLLAGVVGALLPSLRMTLSSPVSDLREVPL